MILILFTCIFIYITIFVHLISTFIPAVSGSYHSLSIELVLILYMIILIRCFGSIVALFAILTRFIMGGALGPVLIFACFISVIPLGCR